MRSLGWDKNEYSLWANAYSSQRSSLFITGFKLTVLGLQIYQQRRCACVGKHSLPLSYHQLQPNGLKSKVLKLPWNMERSPDGISKPLLPHFGNLLNANCARAPRREFLVLTSCNYGSKVCTWCRSCAHLTCHCWAGPIGPECRQRLNRSRTGLPSTLARSRQITVRTGVTQ